MLYFHAKSKVKSKKYHKIKFHTSLKNCGHAETNLTNYTFMQNFRLKGKQDQGLIALLKKTILWKVSIFCFKIYF